MSASSRIAFTILGEPASKANSRKMAIVGAPDKRRILFIKSEKARSYVRTAALQIPKLSPLIEGPCAVTIRIWYASNLPDLDASLVLDVMQDRIYRNDRCVRELHLYHGVDKANPRAEVTVIPLVAQQTPLL